MPTIMLTNDDGIQAKGIRFLVETVKDLGDIYVVAPDEPRSGMASAITTEIPLRLNRHDDFHGAQMWSVSGNPVDCVKLGLFKVLPRRPALILSGINHGSNSGNSVLYSGTMGAVIEGCVQNIPSVGFSLLHHHYDADFTQTAPFIREIVATLLSRRLPDGVCLNVNFPAFCRPKGLKVCKASMGHWTDEYIEQTDPMGRPFYWLSGHYKDTDPDNPATDNYWLDRKWATIVPVCPDMTHTHSIAPLRDIFPEG